MIEHNREQYQAQIGSGTKYQYCERNAHRERLLNLNRTEIAGDRILPGGPARLLPCADDIC